VNVRQWHWTLAYNRQNQLIDLEAWGDESITFRQPAADGDASLGLTIFDDGPLLFCSPFLAPH